MPLTLYYHPLASFCQKVLIALHERAVAFDRRVVDLGDEAQAVELRALWPLGKFPVLVDRGRVVAETSVIIEHLDRHAPGEPLLPAAPEAALEARLWDRVCDQYVQAPMQKIVGDAIRAEGKRDALGVEEARATLAVACGMLDRRLRDRAWLAGEGFSMADCAAAPALFYALTLASLPAGHAALAAYADRLWARPSFRAVLDEARPYFPLYPFADAIPARFR